MTSRFFAGAVAAVVIAGPLRAQERHVVWTATAGPARPVAAGSTITVRLTARIDTGWHVYSITQGAGGPVPTRIALAPGQAFALIDMVHGPKPTTRFDNNFGINVETYDDTADFALQVRVGPAAAVGADTLAITARYQACSASLCLPPRTETVSVPVQVVRSATGSSMKPARADRPPG
jgi:DsbC/DsbD-like thiol-disulfide interchange protein